MRGRDLLSGLPREIMVSDGQVREALARSVKTIVENIKSILEITPPELVADIYRRGIILSGGGALLRGIDQAISEGTGLTVKIADDSLSAVARGAGLLLDDAALLRNVSLPLTDRVR